MHEGTAMERHPLAASTDLRQHPAHDCLTGDCCKKKKKRKDEDKDGGSRQMEEPQFSLFITFTIRVSVGVRVCVRETES